MSYYRSETALDRLKKVGLWILGIGAIGATIVFLLIAYYDLFESIIIIKEGSDITAYPILYGILSIFATGLTGAISLGLLSLIAYIVEGDSDISGFIKNTRKKIKNSIFDYADNIRRKKEALKRKEEEALKPYMDEVEAFLDKFKQLEDDDKKEIVEKAKEIQDQSSGFNNIGIEKKYLYGEMIPMFDHRNDSNYQLNNKLLRKGWK
jgi:hypothetical protein